MAADECIDAMEPRVGAVGHSHVALAFWRQGDRPDGRRASRGRHRARPLAGPLAINPGSVGQPRDGDPRAAGCCSTSSSWTATWRRAEYPIDDAAEAIRAGRPPAALADRLYYGQ